MYKRQANDKPLRGFVEICEHLLYGTDRAVEEMLAYFDETPERFVIRRHRELQEDGVKNIQAFAQIRAELDNTRFVAPPLSERQVRRLIYG